MMKNNIIEVIFSTDTYFRVSFLVKESIFLEKKSLISKTITGDTFVTGELIYEDANNKIYVADNPKWLFTTFIKLLKKKKWSKLATILEEDWWQIHSAIKHERKELLKLLKHINKTYLNYE